MRKLFGTGALALALMAAQAPAASAETRNYNTGWCSYQVSTYQQTSTGSGGGILIGATTSTADRNGGCRWLAAHLQYFGSGGSIVTKYFPVEDASIVGCQQLAVDHHRGKGAAYEWERGFWDYSPWFG